MSEHTEQIAALTRAVTATDVGRRVGWARAYAAEATKDDLSRDLNVMTMERDIMRRAASFMLGFMRVYLERRGDTAAAREALARWAKDVDRVLDDAVVRAGREAADVIVGMDPVLARERAERAAEKKRSKNGHDRAFKAARAKERELLINRYGFPNEAAFHNYLSQYVQEKP